MGRSSSNDFSSAKPSSSSASSTSSSSSRSSSSSGKKIETVGGDVEAGGAGETLADESANEAGAKRRRTSHTRRSTYEVKEPFGLCRLTPRTHWLDGSNIGWQMTCSHPEHNRAGFALCTKTLSNSVSGSEDMTRRMLQWWAARGLPLTSKEQHKDEWVKLAAEVMAGGSVPCAADLDAQAPAEWPRATDAAGPLDPLGGPAAGVPLDVHRRMVVLYESGGLPKTTPDQRARARKTSGTTYAAEKGLTEALTWSYIHPNLKPPPGRVWRLRGKNEFHLAPQGG